MQDQLKERLTGAAILVVVVVLAVPEMFRGHPDVAARSSPPDASAVPLRTYTLVDGDPQAGTPSPAVATPPTTVDPPPAAPSGDAPPAAGVAIPPGTQSAAAGAPTTAVTTATPPAGTASRPATAPAATPPVAAVVQPSAAMQQVAAAAQPDGKGSVAPPRPASARPAAPRPGRTSDKVAAATGGWAVQVGSFRARELAERMVRDVHAKGFKVHVVGPDNRGLYRVRSALQPDREAALALKQQMVARGLKPIVNASP